MEDNHRDRDRPRSESPTCWRDWWAIGICLFLVFGLAPLLALFLRWWGD
jgi:hypothetical protein